MKKLGTILILLFGGGLLLIVLLVIALRIALRFVPNPWPEPLPHVQLEPTRPFLKGSEVTDTNAYFYIRQLEDDEDIAPEAVRKERDQFNETGWIAGAYTNLAEWAVRNRAPLELVDQAVALPFCQMETLTSPEDILPYISPVLQLSRGIQVEAVRAAFEEDWDRSATQLQKLFMLNDHMHRGGVLVCRLVGYAGGHLGCTALQRIAEEHPIPLPLLRDYIMLLESLDENQEPFVEAMRYERMFGQACIDLVFNKGPEETLGTMAGLDTNLPLKRFGPLLGSRQATVSRNLDLVYARLIDQADTDHFNPENGQAEEDLVVRLKGSHPLQLAAHDPIGRILAAIIIPAVGKAQETHFEYLVQLRGTRTGLAVRGYEREHEGVLPERLSDLVPDYLASMPADPFSPENASLQYKKTGANWSIYSLGANQEDGGGKYNGFDREVKKAHPEDYDLVIASNTFAERRKQFLEQCRLNP